MNDHDLDLKPVRPKTWSLTIWNSHLLFYDHSIWDRKREMEASTNLCTGVGLSVLSSRLSSIVWPWCSFSWCWRMQTDGGSSWPRLTPVAFWVTRTSSPPHLSLSLAFFFSLSLSTSKPLKKLRKRKINNFLLKINIKWKYSTWY